jgi:hypothetical protein
MIKYLLIVFVLISCGGEATDSDSNTKTDGITTLESLPFTGDLEVMDGDNPCFGGSFYYIQYNNISYQVSDYSSESFKTTIKKIMDNETDYKPFEAGGCHNKYKLYFQGKMTKEMKWVGAGEVMTDVIQVESFKIQ